MIIRKTILGKFVKNSSINCIKVYQKIVSPLFPPSCIYSPTCSQYAIEAIEKYGFLKGGLMSIKRILRCNPYSKGGYDPVK